MKALSIRQPWAWLIVNGFKPIENRDWITYYRGEFLVHAGKAMTHDDYNACRLFVRGFAPEIADRIPPIEQLERGGIVGHARIVACVNRSDSPWFTGDWGFVLEQASPLSFRPCRGQLGWFELDEPKQHFELQLLPMDLHLPEYPK